MSNPKFTPGPWEALPSHIRLTGETSRTKFSDGRWVINPVDDYERVPLAEVDQGDDLYPPARKQAEYNAKLIAQSPMMYAFIHRLIDDSQLDIGWREEAEKLLAECRGET